MTILYTLVARGSVVLAEFSNSQTNASTIARQRTDGLTVLCMADDVTGRRVPFTFLEDIHQRFVRTYDRINRIKGEMSQVRTVFFDISSLGGGVCYGGICLPWAYTSYLFKETSLLKREMWVTLKNSDLGSSTETGSKISILEVAQPLSTISFQYPDIYIGSRNSRNGHGSTFQQVII
ncbi:hypothetical protein L2E82_37651 [Cichorium intybus]|uniref:Uncharacterized protein n=1 Tax=Cichorium intybus TaxID=13427 RepID=A0ACB9AFG0_CICIN|nr:hypothetical protein L2E82_37651 [Cichorium intybus]